MEREIEQKQTNKQTKTNEKKLWKFKKSSEHTTEAYIQQNWKV
jgi:hypothetical protein